MKDTWDDYLIEGTNTLKNKFNISNKEELLQKEKEEVLIKLAMLHLEPVIEDCDFENLKGIHKFLFEDIYDFAGEVRTCTLSKNGDNFLAPEKIEEEANTLIEKYNNKIDNATSKDHLAHILGPFYYELISIHPFREGNGRTIREFIREVVLLKSKTLPFCVELDYTKIDKDNLMLGIRERLYYPSMLEYEFMKGLVPLEKTKKI